MASSRQKLLGVECLLPRLHGRGKLASPPTSARTHPLSLHLAHLSLSISRTRRPCSLDQSRGQCQNSRTNHHPNPISPRLDNHPDTLNLGYQTGRSRAPDLLQVTHPPKIERGRMRLSAPGQEKPPPESRTMLLTASYQTAWQVKAWSLLGLQNKMKIQGPRQAMVRDLQSWPMLLERSTFRLEAQMQT